MANAKISPLTNDSMDDIPAQIQTIRADLAKLTSLMVSAGEEQTAALKAAASDKVAAAKAKGQQGVEVVRDQASHYAAEAERFAAEKPATALAIAAGVGFLVGLVTARR